MKTAPNNKKIREVITLVKEGKLIPRPEFQRRLVWTRDDKNKFIDTILRGYPFPEIYLADGEVNLDTGEGTQLLVDGLQRVSTIYQYFTSDPELKLTVVPSYSQLSPEDKQLFLQYDVAVRDLGAVSKEEIIEVFRRLNATKYSLLDIEVSNAVYAGALKRFAEKVAAFDFFQVNSIFNATDYKRMGDLRFCLSVVSTYITGYFNRDEVFEDLLERFNDDFPHEQEINERLVNVIQFIDECGFEPKSRIWRKADLYSLLIELDIAINRKGLALQPGVVLNSIQSFMDGIEKNLYESSFSHAVYYKAALQATNDKINRIRRGSVIGLLIEGESLGDIDRYLSESGLA
jgi:hypothetical protein